MTSTIKVNNIQNQCGANIINESSNTITLGASGDTIALASGASQTGFGRTGTVDWQTGSIKTSTFTAANGEGYFCNTAGGAFTVNLPAGSAGAIVSVSDYTRTFQTNALTITPNGSEKIGGVAASAILSTQGQAATFVYVDATEGWINTQETSNSVTGISDLAATGGTITTSGNFKIHTFTSPGTFQVTSASTTAAENTVGYMVVAGGGGGTGAGGGAGGFREGRNASIDNFTASPLVANAPTNAVTVTAQSYPITVGAGGAGANPGYSGNNKANGSNSIFSTITSAGGGAGGSSPNPSPGGDGVAGGSGGGSGNHPGGTASAGAGNTPPVSPAQGFNGGTSSPAPGNAVGMGGGGGSSAVGTNGTQGPTPAGNAGSGGNGVTSSISASPVTRGGGGGGGAQGTSTNTNLNNGGTGGGGNGGTGNVTLASGNGTANFGGGGGGNVQGAQAGAGGSGVVIIRYKFQ